MSLLDRKKISEATIKDPKELFGNVLKAVSGASYSRSLNYKIFYRIIGFKGTTEGVGCSTIVCNTALALADLGLNVCVFDTSIQHPVQDKLLKTNVDSIEKEDRLDWFDIPYTESSVLHTSSRNRKISVLSFYGKHRTVLDMLTSQDSPELVDIAIDKVQDKFDIILIDLCDELTKVNIFSMQKSQHVIQIWDDSISALNSLDDTITNNVLLSCPMDKMRYVIENKIHDDVMGDLDVLYKQYRFTKLSHCVNSTEISRLCSMNQVLWQYPTNNEEITMFTKMILDIVKHICNISDDDISEAEKEDKKASKEKGKNTESKDAKTSREGTKPKKRVTASDVSSGKVEGTVHNKMKKQAEKVNSIVSTPNLSDDDETDLFS